MLGSSSGRGRGRGALKVVLVLFLLLITLTIVVMESEWNLLGYAAAQSNTIQHSLTGIVKHPVEGASGQVGKVEGSRTYRPDDSPDQLEFITTNLTSDHLPDPLRYDLSHCASTRKNVCYFRSGLFGRSISNDPSIHCQVPFAEPDTTIDLVKDYPDCKGVRGMTDINGQGEIGISCQNNMPSATYILGPRYQDGVNHTHRCTPNTKCQLDECSSGWPGLEGQFGCYNETQYDMASPPILGDREWVFTTCHLDLRELKEWEFNYVAAERSDTLARLARINARRMDTPNVLLIVLDGLSRASFHRQFPRTAAVMSYYTRRQDVNQGNKHETYEFLRYHILEEGTMMNMGGLLTGIPTHYSFERQRDTWLWKVARDHGYVTFFGRESCPAGWEFDWQRNPDVDHLLVEPFCFPSPWAWNTADGPHCLSRKSAFNTILEGYGQLLNLYHEYPVMGVIHADEPHESSQTVARTLDVHLATFMRNTLDKHPNTVFAITGDHGMQFGGYYTTKAGQVEHRLPPLFLVLPKQILDRDEAAKRRRTELVRNQQMLTTHYDTHKTLVHIMTNFSMDINAMYPQSREGFNWEGTFNFVSSMKDKHDVIPTVFPYSHSLFTRISAERTCEDACIPSLWCICSPATELDLTVPEQKAQLETIVSAVLGTLNTINTQRYPGGCLNMTIGNLLEVRYVKEKHEVTTITNIDKEYVYTDVWRAKVEVAVTPSRDTQPVLEMDIMATPGMVDYRMGYLYRMDRYGTIKCREPKVANAPRRARMECVCAT